MKILHVETGRHLYGGPQQVLYLMQGLTERGHECTLVCPPASGIDSAGRAKGLSVRNLFCAGDLDLPFAYRLVQFINDYKPDIVHCHSRRGADVLGGLAAKFADVPAVVSRRVDNTEMKLVAALRYRPFSRIVAISEKIASVLREHDVEASRITVIRSAVDTEQLAEPSDCVYMRDQFHVPEDAFVIASAAQLIPRKGHRFLLKAMADIKSTHPHIYLAIFGQGPLEAELKGQAESLGITDRVTFAGFREDLDSYFTCLDLFVHPALAEGLGVATLKAQAAGVPVVAFESGGLPEAVLHGETGLLVKPEDSDALRRAIIRLADDDELRARYSHAARERMRAEFSIDAMVEKHVELYESILND